MPRILLPLHTAPLCVAAIAAAPLLSLTLLAQQPAATSSKPAATSSSSPASSTPPATAPATLKVNVKAVTMTVTVRDKHDNIIPNLTKDDFTLQEDNRPQTISYFARDTNLPLNLGLLVDTSGSQRNALDDERTASEHFLDQMITDAKDKAFLIQFDREVDLLVDLTSDKGKLRSAVEKLGAPQFQNNNGDQTRNGGRGGGTQLYDSIYLASDELMQKQPGRKALIVLTDGVDRGSKETINGALEAAQRADTAIYAIYFKGEESHDNNNGNHRGMGHGGGFPGGGGGYPGGGGGYPGGGGGYPGGGGGYPGGGGGGQGRSTQPHVDGKKVLERICGETGGRMFEVSKKDNIDAIYSKIAEELRAQYILSYTPDKQSNDNGFHRILLTGKKKDWNIQTRAGYYSGPQE